MLVTVLLAVMLLTSRQVDGAISYVQSVGAFGQYYGFGPASVDIPVTTNVTSGNSVIVTLMWGAFGPAETAACSDSQGNSYTVDIEEYYSGSGHYTVVCSSHNVTALTAADTITVSFSSGTYGVAATAHEFSGLASASTVDQTASANGNSSTPASGSTAVTTQADELLIGAIGVSGPPTDIFTPGSGYTALASIGFSDAWNGTIYPEYRIVSATGAFQADGTLNLARGWAAGIATYKAAPSGVSVTLSGTLYSDEGITPVSGQTVRLLIDGISAGTSVTDGSGNYSITTTVAAGDDYVPLLLYVDNGTVDATTVTVMDPVNYPTTIADLVLYANHLIVRDDNEGQTNNGDMSSAKGLDSDADILYSVSGSDLTVAGANTELYVASGYRYTPGGNVTTAHMQIEGTLTAGNNTFTVSGNWEHANGTFSYGTSTVDFTGTGTISAGDIWWTKPFYNVNAAATGETTTILAGKGIGVTNVLSLGSGTLAGGNVNLSLDSGTPLVTAGAAITNSQIKFHPNSGGSVTVAGTAYTNIWLAGNAATNTFNLSGNMTCTVLSVYGSGPGDSALFDTSAGSYSVACDELVIGASSSTDRYGTLKLNNSTLNITGNISINSSDLSGTNQIDAGSATINIGGNWTNNDTFTAGTSTVNLNGANQILKGSTTFYNLSKTVTSADTLTFAAGTTQTVFATATLQGASGQLLRLRSNIDGARWNFTLAAGATKAISYVDVQSSDASGSDSSLIEINPAYSIDSGGNVSWFGNANISVVKSSSVVSDPVNGTTNPKRIPGAVVEYSILVTNTSGAQATNLVVTDDLSGESANLSFVADAYAAGKGIQVTAPNISGGLAVNLTNAADTDQGDYGATGVNTVTVTGIVLDAGEQATVRFRVVIQ